MTRRTTVLWLALALAGCGAKDQTKRYPMEGSVKALDPATRSATIAAGKIGDWMEAMTMEYAVKPDAEFQKLFVGARIRATVLVNGDTYYVTEIKILPITASPE
jgi:Cu/Ag efflux protein CusF